MSRRIAAQLGVDTFRVAGRPANWARNFARVEDVSCQEFLAQAECPRG